MKYKVYKAKMDELYYSQEGEELRRVTPYKWFKFLSILAYPRYMFKKVK